MSFAPSVSLRAAVPRPRRLRLAAMTVYIEHQSESPKRRDAEAQSSRCLAPFAPGRQGT